MIKKFLTYIFFTTLFFLFPTSIFATNLDITCFSDRPPEVVRNTDPLFQISGFAPGDSASRTIFVENTDSENDCRIFFEISGSTNILTNKIDVNIPGLFSGTLSEYIGSNVMMANLAPNREVTREIIMNLPTDAGNVYARRQASFDIIVQSEWGEDAVIDEEDEDDDVDEVTPAVAGVVDFFTDFIEGMIGIGMQDVVEEEEEVEEETEKEENDIQEVLGVKDEEVCTEKTLWWIPLVVQLILTLVVIFVNKPILRPKRVKILISILLGIISYFIVRWIGCGCAPVWLCVNHWILNSAIALSSVLTYIQRKKVETT